MNRSIQVAVWVFLAPVLGAIQAVASFGLMLLERGSGDNGGFYRMLTGLAVVYGGGWFIPALLVSDLFLLRRTLSRQDFARYISIIIVIGLLAGLVMPGILVMIGYPVTAAGIVGCGLLFRKKPVRAGLG